MINGTIAICPRCGGEANVGKHLIDSHRESGEIHLVWQHYACGYNGEVVVSKKTLKSCVEFNQVGLGKVADDQRELSEAEEELIEFSAELFNVKTIADIGWEVEL